MTAACGGGTSSPKPGAAQNIAVGINIVADALDAMTPWFLPVQALIDGWMWASQPECSTDPPPTPTFDATDMLIIPLGTLAPNYSSTIQKLVDVTKIFLWHQQCQCDTAPTPAPPVISPTGAPGGNASATPQPCFVGGWTGNTPYNNTGSVSGFKDVAANLLPTTGPPIQLPINGVNVNAYPVPPGLNQLDMTSHSSSFNGDPYTYAPGVLYTFWDASHTLTDSVPMQQDPSLNAPKDQQHIATLSKPAAFGSALAGYYNADYGANQQNEPTTLNVRMLCGSGTTTGIESCCPPDPSVGFALNQILQLEQRILSRLTSSYTKGTAHPGLSGSGSLQVTGVSGVLVDITAAPPTKVQPGNPAYIWDMGWLSILTGDGMIDEKRLTRTHQIWLPPAATAAITLGYYLNPGVTATLTELLPA